MRRPSQVNNTKKKIEENNRMGKTGDLFKELEIPREHNMEKWAQERTEIVWSSQKQEALIRGIRIDRRTIQKS